MTDYSLLRWTAQAMIHDLEKRRDTEWHTGDSYDKIQTKIDRLERFDVYVKLHQEFNP